MTTEEIQTQLNNIEIKYSLIRIENQLKELNDNLIYIILFGINQHPRK